MYKLVYSIQMPTYFRYWHVGILLGGSAIIVVQQISRGYSVLNLEAILLTHAQLQQFLILCHILWNVFSNYALPAIQLMYVPTCIITFHVITHCSLSHSVSIAPAIAIAATVCTLIAFIAGVLCGAMVTVCISRWHKKGDSSKPASTIQEQQPTVPVYEEVEAQSQKIELKENVAYGPVKVH